MKVNQQNAELIIREVMEANNRVVIQTRNQQGVEVIDYFDPNTRRGVRIEKSTGGVDTFLTY